MAINICSAYRSAICFAHSDTRVFLKTIAQSNKYHFESMFGDSVVWISKKINVSINGYI